MAQNNDGLVIPAGRHAKTIENAVSLVGGTYLLYDALKKKEKSVPEVLAAGFMIYRGISGFIADVKSNREQRMPRAHTHGNINVHTRLLIKRPLNEVYNFWRHLGNLPLFMKHLDSVTVLSDTRSDWKVNVPGLPAALSWKAEIVAEEPNRFIGWRSVSGSTLGNVGKITFKDAGELGTLVHVVFSYHAPMGVAGEEIARLLNPVFEKMVRNDILGVKRYLETGNADKRQQETVAIFT